MRLRFLASTALLCLTPALFAASPKRALAAANAIHYGPDPAQILEIHYPAGPGPFAWVMWVHGGGWTEGTFAGSSIPDGLNPLGYAVVSLEYRKNPQVRPEVSVSDVGNAIAYLQANAGKLKLAQQFSIMGHSSGSHQVALFAVDPQYAAATHADLSHMYAWINLDGIFDVKADIDGNAKGKKIDHQQELFGTDPAHWAAMSPVDIVAKNGAPAFHVCVVRELTNPEYKPQSAEWVAALQKAHAKLTVKEIPDYSHVELVKNFALAGGPVLEGVMPCLPPK
jgi:acetyl esterase/lipase